MQNSEPSLNQKEPLGSLERVENLDEVDSLDECTVQEDLPDGLAASKEPAEQTVVQVDEVSGRVIQNLIAPKKISTIRDLLYSGKKRLQSQTKPQGILGQ